MHRAFSKTKHLFWNNFRFQKSYRDSIEMLRNTRQHLYTLVYPSLGFSCCQHLIVPWFTCRNQETNISPLLLTKLWILFIFCQLFHKYVVLFQNPIQHIKLYSVIRSWGDWELFWPVFPDRSLFFKTLKVLKTSGQLFCRMSLSWDSGYEFWEEDNKVLLVFLSHNIKGTYCQCDGIDLEHMTEVVVLGFSTSPPPPPSPSLLCSLKACLWIQSTHKG